MKKYLALLLVVVMLFSLSGCDVIDTLLSGKEKPDGGGDADTTSESTVDTALLWSALNGVWAGNDGVFVWFDTEDDGTLSYTTGVMFSGDIRGGFLSEAKKTGENSYSLKILFPKMSQTDENEGYDEFTTDISLSTNLTDDPKTIDATDIITGNSVRTFMYRGADLDSLSGDLPSSGQTSEQGLSHKDAWDWFGGIWGRKDGNNIRFVYFSMQDGGFSVGTLFSGDVMGGQLSTYECSPSEEKLMFNVYQPAYENMEGSSPEVEFAVTVDYSDMDNGVLSVSYGGNPSFEYRYISMDFESVGDLEHLLSWLP